MDQQVNLGRKLLPLAIYLLYLLAFLFCLKREQYVFKESISIDLLYRVVGSRLMADGKSAYYTQWQHEKQDPARYYHPIPRLSQHINGVTITPGFLWLNSVFNEWSFCNTMQFWFYFQIGLLFITGLLLLISLQNVFNKLLAAAVLIPFFVCSRNFILHLHSAQVYIIYAFIFTLIYLLLKSRYTWKYIALGALITIAVWLKPFFIVLFLPFLIRKNFDVLKGAIPIALILLIHAIAMNHLGYWKEYLKAMPEYAQDIPLSPRADFMQRYAPEFTVTDCIYPMKYPWADPLKGVGLMTMEYYVLRFGGNYSGTTGYAIAAMLIVLGITFITRKRQLSIEQMFALLFLLYLTVELFSPTLRFGYYLVQWLAPSVVVIISYRTNKLAAAIMLLGLLINHGYIPVPYVYQGSCGEALMIINLALFVIMHPKKVSQNTILSDHRVE